MKRANGLLLFVVLSLQVLRVACVEVPLTGWVVIKETDTIDKDDPSYYSCVRLSASSPWNCERPDDTSSPVQQEDDVEDLNIAVLVVVIVVFCLVFVAFCVGACVIFVVMKLTSQGSRWVVNNSDSSRWNPTNRETVGNM
eukprot:TRINITY_DN13606_c0_g1_i1.p1 TRINITY_DN13606_c0_g1~~TRINITY_DN13606_c0_g1_i1.p1  ORF type:complete len:140 (+),score=13.05 TRINITY_DN13606_c0_g1_i1:43-462(+)